jgi:hypothetical protein
MSKTQQVLRFVQKATFLEFGNGTSISMKASVVNPRFDRAAEASWGSLFKGVESNNIGEA